MEYLGDESFTVKHFLDVIGNFDHPGRFSLNLTAVVLSQLVDAIAQSLATMHSGDTIHGDLTTSNMMLKPQISIERQLSGIKKLSPHEVAASGNLGDLVSSLIFDSCQYLIDFGLSQVSTKTEDKAVDFYVLKRAFISTHPGSEAFFERILEKYRDKTSNGHQIIAKFREVELRGRKRECFG